MAQYFAKVGNLGAFLSAHPHLSHGLRCVCLSPSDTRSFSLLMSRTTNVDFLPDLEEFTRVRETPPGQTDRPLNRFPTVSSIRQINKWIDASRHSTIDDYPIPRHPFDELVRSDSLFYLFHLHYGLGHLLLRQSLPVLRTFSLLCRSRVILAK